MENKRKDTLDYTLTEKTDMKYERSQTDRHPAKMTNLIWAVHILTSSAATQRKLSLRQEEKLSQIDAVNCVVKYVADAIARLGP